MPDEKATIDRYEAPTPPENRWPALGHPLNVEELKAKTLAAVLAKQPGIDLHGPCLIFTCPDEIAAKTIWRS